MPRAKEMEPMEITDELLAQYKAATHRERAQIEAEVWLRAPREARDRVGNGKRGYRSQHWVQEQLNAPSAHDVNMRMRLLAHGDAIAALWERVEHDMSLGSAYTIVRAAQKDRKVREPLEDAVARALQEYDSRGAVRSGADGKVYRVHKGSSLAGREQRRGRDTFWDKMRDLIAAYLTERLSGLDEAVVERERDRFERELKVLFDATSSRLHRLKYDARNGLSPVVAKRELREACDVLKIDPPRAVDREFMKRAKTRFRSLAKEYHPDHRGDATRLQYEAVLDAWHAIERYHEHFGKDE